MTLKPDNITVNLPVREDYSTPEVNYTALEGETVEALIARVTEAHPDLTSIVLVAVAP